MTKIKTIQIIHLAFCAAPSVFLFAALGVIDKMINLDFNNVGEEPILVIAPIFLLIVIPLSAIIPKTVLKRAVNELNISTEEKLIHYQTYFLVKSAFLEGAALFNIVAFLITANLLVLIFAVVAIVLLSLNRPTKERINEELNLQYPEAI